MHSILYQAGSNSAETRIALRHAMLSDLQISPVRTESLANHVQELRSGTALPIGSIEFVRRAMTLAGIPEPENFSYPDILRPFLRRQVEQRSAGSVLGHWFVKPTTTKAFTGFVFDTLGNPDHLSCHDRAQYNAFLSMPPQAPVWVSEPITWLSEVRYYVSNDNGKAKVLGGGRYDDGPGMSAPNMALVEEMAALLASEPNAPAAFSLDVGILDSGETALIECNDFWALGYYKGSLAHKDYIALLWQRWEQLTTRPAK